MGRLSQPPSTDTTLDRIEAQVREGMARIARMDVRGWDTAQERADEIAVLDAHLDRLNELRRKA